MFRPTRAILRLKLSKNTQDCYIYDLTERLRSYFTMLNTIILCIKVVLKFLVVVKIGNCRSCHGVHMRKIPTSVKVMVLLLCFPHDYCGAALAETCSRLKNGNKPGIYLFWRYIKLFKFLVYTLLFKSSILNIHCNYLFRLILATKSTSL